MGANILELKPEELRKRHNPDDFTFGTTAELPPVVGLINQPRALEAMEIALLSQDKRFNLRIVQHGITSRASAVISELERIANENFAGTQLYDFCYETADDPLSPTPLILPSGQGHGFAGEIIRLREDLAREVAEEFSQDDFREKSEELFRRVRDWENERRKPIAELNEKFGISLRLVHLFIGNDTNPRLYIVPEMPMNLVTQGAIPIDRVVFVGNPGAPMPGDFYVLAPYYFEEWLGTIRLSGDLRKELLESVISLNQRLQNNELKQEEAGSEVEATNRRFKVNLRLIDFGNSRLAILPEVPREYLGPQGGIPPNMVIPIGNSQNPDFYVFSAEHLEKWAATVRLGGEEKERFKTHIDELTDSIRKDARKFNTKRRNLMRKYDKGYTALCAKTVGQVFDSLTSKLKNKYPDACGFIKSLRTYCVDNYGIFQQPPPGVQVSIYRGGGWRDPFEPFNINVLHSNEDCKDAVPIVYEPDPTFYNLFGRKIRQHNGAFQPVHHGNPQGMHNAPQMSGFANHMSLRAGSLLRANGGVLIIPHRKWLKKPDLRISWDALLAMNENSEFVLEDLMEKLGWLPTDGLKPKPIPLDVRIVLISDSEVDGLFSRFLPEDYSFFRRKGELVPDMPRTPENERRFAQILGSISRNSGILHCDKEATSRFVELSSRLAEHQDKLSLNFNKPKDVLLQADIWAKKRGSDVITADDVRTALEHEVFRANYMQERIIDLMRDGVIKIDVSGSQVGEVNGLVVYDLGDFSFAKPSVVSARTRVGRQDIVNVEAEIQHAGPIQKKSVHIVAGFLDGKFFQDKVPALHARLVFEQSYEGLEGDSASVAEFLVLISFLAGMPLKKNLAVTGSCNQKGEVQAIGGQNQKVEGFFDVCKAFNEVFNEGKWPGDQGVVLPRDNVQHLMLREDIVEAVANGEFHVYAVSHLDQVLELFTDMPAEEVYKRVDAQLAEYSRISSGQERKSSKEIDNDSFNESVLTDY